MTNLNNKFDNAKDKLIGEVKEAAGKITGNEQMELKGKIQSTKSDLKKKMNLKNKVDKTKDYIAGKINDKIDEMEDKKENK